MPKFTFTSPEGKTYDVDGPEGSTKEQAFGVLQQRLGSPKKGPTEQDVADLTMTGPEKGAEAAGSLLSGAVAAPVAGLAGIAGSVLPGEPGQGARAVRAVEDALTFKPKSSMGKNLTGLAAYPFEKLHQGGEAVGRKAQDAGAPAIVSTALQTAIEAAPMALGAGARAKAPIIPKTVDPAVTAANKAGFKLTPEEAGGGWISQLLSGFSGEPKLSKKIKQENQQPVNEKIATDLGLPKDTVVTPKVLDDVRQKAGGAYDALRGVGDFVVDANYADSGLGPKKVSNWQGAKSMDPGSSYHIPAAEAVESLKQLRADSTGFYRQYARNADPETLAKAKGARDAAAQLEALIERNLDGTAKPIKGDPNFRDVIPKVDPKLLKDFQDARVTYAKTFAAEKAMNPVTGDFNPEVYGKMLNPGPGKKPLTGGMEEVARNQRTFPRSIGGTERLGSTGMTMGDVALDLISRAGSNATHGLMFARPAIRSALSSDLGQKLITSPSITPQIAEIIRQIQAAKATAPAEMATEERRK